MVKLVNGVRILRESLGLTQEQLGRGVGVSRQTINAIEAGRYKPSLVLALKLARVFSLPVEKVFSLEPGD